MTEHDPKLQQDFTEQAGILLADGTGHGELSDSCKRLEGILRPIVAGDINQSASLSGVYGAYFGDGSAYKIDDFGLAVQPIGAANCLGEDIRTRVFARGLKSAIERMMRITDERPIRVLEAGSGPYSLVAMLVAPFFKEGDVEFTPLDVYRVSIDCAEKVARVLGQINKFGGFVRDNATTYRIVGKKPHIVISETMQTRLKVEPQVAITANLGDQLAENGIFLPEAARIYAELTDEHLAHTQSLGDIFVLTSRVAGDVEKASGIICPESWRRLCHVRKTLNAGRPIKHGEKVSVKTEVRVFGDEILKPGQSSITESHHDHVFGSPSGALTFEFLMGAKEEQSDVRIS